MVVELSPGKKGHGWSSSRYLNLFPTAALFWKYTKPSPTFRTELPSSAKHLTLSPIYMLSPNFRQTQTFAGRPHLNLLSGTGIWTRGREKCDCFLRKAKLKTHVWFGSASRSRRTGALPNRKKRLWGEGRNKADRQCNACPPGPKQIQPHRPLMTMSTAWLFSTKMGE